MSNQMDGDELDEFSAANAGSSTFFASEKPKLAD
jgi:hypothetical protein